MNKEDFYKWINYDPIKLITLVLEQYRKIINKDYVINELLKRIAILEREVEKHEGF